MIKSLIHYQIYIIVGILSFPLFAFIIYFTKKTIDKIKFLRTLETMKKPLMERINAIESLHGIRNQQEYMSDMIKDIKVDIETLKKEIQTPRESIIRESSEEIYQQAIIQHQAYQSQTEQQTRLQKEQVRVMNENISKFLMVYREKDKIIEDKSRTITEKNKSISLLQQRIHDAEKELRRYTAEEGKSQKKDLIIKEKEVVIYTLQKKLQEIENNAEKITLYNKSVIEREQLKNKILEEKKIVIEGLEERLKITEKRLQETIDKAEQTKDDLLKKKLIDIDGKIITEKKKNLLLIGIAIVVIVSVLIYVYLQDTQKYTI